jgi:fluoroacetyl-CoA thioesterase
MDPGCKGLRAGLKGVRTVVVEPQHTITFMGPHVPQALASPWLLFFMEHTARETVLPHLPEGHDSVGVGFQFEHVRAAPVGAELKVEAEVLAAAQNRLTFRVQASWGDRLIGSGVHVRAVVSKRWFGERLRRQSENRIPESDSAPAIQAS